MEVENLLDNIPSKKKIKTGRKGKRVERDVCHIFNARFGQLLTNNPSCGMFSRTIGSGNRWGQGVILSAQAKQTFSGDIACPTNFIWTLESKGGYNDVDLNSAFDGGHSQIDEFIKQVSDDAERTGRKPMILWKKDRKPRLAIIKTNDLKGVFANDDLPYVMYYREWALLNLDLLLGLPDTFWFNLQN